MYVEHLEHRERMETHQHVTVIGGGSSVILPRVWVSKDIAVFFPSANTSQHTHTALPGRHTKAANLSQYHLRVDCLWWPGKCKQGVSWPPTSPCMGQES